MNTNSAAFEAKVFPYLLASIYDYDGEETPAARAQFIWDRFNREYNHANEKRRQPNLQLRVADWLSGLPLNIAWTNGDIIELSESWQGRKLSDREAERRVSGYFAFMALQLLKLWKAHGVQVEY